MRTRVFFQHLALFLLFLFFEGTTNRCFCAPVDVNADAKTIVDSKCNPKVVASILPYRTQKECAAINKAIASMNGGNPLVDPKYVPLVDKKPYKDLLFALVNEPMTVFSMYLGYYLDLMDTNYITMIYIQIATRKKCKEVYDKQHETTFDDACSKLKDPFLTAMKAWTEKDRADNSIYGPNCDDSCDQGKWLADERQCWNNGPKGRTGLEGMLMKHTIKYAKKGLECFEKRAGDITDAIEKIKKAELVDLYTSLARYIEDENDYLARLLHGHGDGEDHFALWIIIFTTRRSREAIKAIDSSFQKAYDGVTVRDYILQSKAQYNVTKDMLAALIDPTYKPS